jgi:MarR family transcriptional regulator, lower aerobic nicotinate degradation pathway regulator
VSDAPILALHEAPGHLIRCLQQRHTLLWSQEFNGDLTGPQYAVICAIGAEGRLDQSEVGRRASLDKSSTADVVARLDGLGWLRRVQDPADGRRKILRLTPLARTALGEITRRVGLVQERLIAPLTPDRVTSFMAALQLVAYAGEPPVAAHTEENILLLSNTPGHLIRRAQQVHTVAWGEQVGGAVTAPQCAVLSALRAHPNGLDQTAVAELASLDKSSMADIAARLVKRGWVVRTRDTADARRRLLRLGGDVGDELADLTPAVQRVQEQLLRPLPSNKARAEFIGELRTLAFADRLDDGRRTRNTALS